MVVFFVFEIVFGIGEYWLDGWIDGWIDWWVDRCMFFLIFECILGV